MHLLISIGLLVVPNVSAQVPIYDTIKQMVEYETAATETEIAIQRFALGVYYDFVVLTNKQNGNEVESVPFEMEKEEYVDYSIQTQIERMCGTQANGLNDYFACTKAQAILRNLVDQSTWLRALGRDLQAIASGYEAGIDGYPGKPIDIMAKFAGINHIWKAANDPFVTPILEKLTRARPWPHDESDNIEAKADEIVNEIKNLEIEWQEKKDRTELSAAMWRYRHGVEYVKDHEGEDCEQANYDLDGYLDCLQEGGSQESCSAIWEGSKSDPSMVLLQLRWCPIEQKMEELIDLIQKDDVDVSPDEQVVYPSYINQEENIVIWMRSDDVGLQWYLPMEPVQATLFHPDYGDCIESGDIRGCAEQYKEFIIRGGKYPSKLGDEERSQQPSLMGGGDVHTIPEDAEEADIRKNNAVVLEPELGDGICSHPFSKRGYLCRTIESTACDVTAEQEDQLKQAGTGGIVLTRCEPERFKAEVAMRTSGSDVCDIGGWREELENPEAQSILPEDTPEKQPDMLPPPCARCVVDIECKDECVPGDSSVARSDPEARNGVYDICVPNNPPNHMVYYLMMHEMTHAMQNCGQSNLESMERTGISVEKEQGVKNCCSLEREAYFVQCKLLALDGVLEHAGITIDQCASTFANFSCSDYDDNPDDDNYVCTTDNVNPNELFTKMNESLGELADTLDLPETCTEALNHPRVKAVRNSLPASCEPGCMQAYANTIGNNLCYAGQCIEETHERSRDIAGRIGLTTVSESFPWDSCELDDPQIGAFEAPPAITGPKFPTYRPQQIVRLLDMELCQINGLPASTPPVLCAFDPVKRLGLPPISLIESVSDLQLQPDQYDATGLGIQYSASAIASRITSDMFRLYMQPASQHFADLVNTMYDMFDQISELKFPKTMCPRFVDEGFSCEDLE